MSTTHVVVGAPGGIGRAICAELARRGLPIRAVSRSGTPVAGTEAVSADAADPAAMRDVCRDAAAAMRAAMRDDANRMADPEPAQLLSWLEQGALTVLQTDVLERDEGRAGGHGCFRAARGVWGGRGCRA